MRLEVRPVSFANGESQHDEADIAANFVQVETFCSRAPQRSPTTFTNVRIAIRSKPSKCARVKATPSTVKTHMFLRDEGNDLPEVCG